jgi:OmcA/MtrC family decaheme c-type cytochrome
VLTVHGNNRTDDIQVCAMCHNPNATDIGQRVADTQCTNELGGDDEPIDLKYMIHAIHAGTTGICGFGNSAHPYGDVVYPGRLQNCEGCHTAETTGDGRRSYDPVDPASVLATTFDANDPATPADDRAVSPNTAACSACHTSSSARAHMELNGGSFSLTKNADGTTAGGPVETCSVCHGAGRSADVRQAHRVGEFRFN